MRTVVTSLPMLSANTGLRLSGVLLVVENWTVPPPKEYRTSPDDAPSIRNEIRLMMNGVAPNCEAEKTCWNRKDVELNGSLVLLFPSVLALAFGATKVRVP